MEANTPHFFGSSTKRVYDAATVDRIDAIAQRHGVSFVSIREPNGQYRNWFEGPDFGDPSNQETARAVRTDLEAADLGWAYGAPLAPVPPIPGKVIMPGKIEIK